MWARIQNSHLGRRNAFGNHLRTKMVIKNSERWLNRELPSMMISHPSTESSGKGALTDQWGLPCGPVVQPMQGHGLGPGSRMILYTTEQLSQSASAAEARVPWSPRSRTREATASATEARVPWSPRSRTREATAVRSRQNAKRGTGNKDQHNQE